MRSFGLATKIAVPFVALFALLLAVLGGVLARGIFQEVEGRVEREQRFALSVATFRDIPLNESFLRGIRDRIQGEDAEGPDFVVLEGRAAPLTTLATDEPAAAAALADLLAAARDPVALPGLGGVEATEEVQATRLELGGRGYLVLYVTRWPGDKRRDIFLLYPQANIEAAQWRALRKMAWLGAAGLLLAALLARLVAEWISRPVRRLAAAAARFAAGGLNEPLEPELESAHDEIGRLSAAFRAMVESLRRSQAELVKHERLAATGKLAATVAHEIRNPLTSLRMTVGMLSQRGGDAATDEAYQVVLGEINRLALTVEELLTFARPHPAQRAPTDLNQLAAATVEFLRRQLQHARVEARLEPDPRLPAWPLDPNKVRQLLYNLILNAMQAMVRDGTVTIRTRWDEGARRAWLEVSDTGPGIPDEVRERLFDPFVSTKPGGGGLGLAIAKQVVEEHGGRISFETSPTGTTFRAEFPEDGTSQTG
jgi:signal transduction histidine kinase